MKTKEEIIAVIEKIKSLNIALSVADYEAVLHYLKLSTLNPMKIDEERMNDISMSLYEERISPMSDMKRMIDKYNSTCKDHQVLQPLPSEIPKELRDKYIKDDSYFLKDMWQELIKHYGTPTKKELVSVEELAKEIKNIYVPCSEEKKLSYVIAQHLVNKYGLNPPKREWWMDLKEGEKFKDGKGGVFIFDGMFYIGSDGVYSHPANKSTPCIEPSIHDKVKEKLGIELYQEFMKEVKGA